MLCPPNVFKLETILHFEKDFKKHGIEEFYRKGRYFSRNYIHGNSSSSRFNAKSVVLFKQHHIDCNIL
jgi:hypothetical protein